MRPRSLPVSYRFDYPSWLCAFAPVAAVHIEGPNRNVFPSLLFSFSFFFLYFSSSSSFLLLERRERTIEVERRTKRIFSPGRRNIC